MTGTPQKTGKLPLYKICCLVPQQTDEKEIIYLSSVSEINRFLQVHGISDRFRVDTGRSSTSTCTEDLAIAPELGKLKIISDPKGNSSKETIDRQIQYNWKNVNSLSCYRNEILPWHRCTKNDSLIHFCKKSSSSIYDEANNCLVHEKLVQDKEEFSKLKDRIAESKEIPKINDNNINNNQATKHSRTGLNKSKTKKSSNFKSRSLIGIFKKQKKLSNTVVQKPERNFATREKSTEACDNPIDNTIEKRIHFLLESVVCETTSESIAIDKPSSIPYETIEEGDKGEKNRVITVEETKVEPPVPYEEQVNENKPSKSEQKETSDDSDSDWAETISNESTTTDCHSEEKRDNEESSIYQSPKKFIKDISTGVMKSFIEEECDASWTKSYKDKRIPKKSLGIDKDLSTLYILKKMIKHKTSDCLLSHLTPRQKRVLAVAIVNSLEEFSINGTRWSGVTREILRKVCRIFKGQGAFV